MFTKYRKKWQEEKIWTFSAEAPQALAERAWPGYVSFDIPGSSLEARCIMKCIGEEYEFVVGVSQKTSNRQYEYWLRGGEREEMMDYLASEILAQEIFRSVLDLSGAVQRENR